MSEWVPTEWATGTLFKGDISLFQTFTRRVARGSGQATSSTVAQPLYRISKDARQLSRKPYVHEGIHVKSGLRCL